MVLAVAVEGETERSVTVVDAPALPLKWRCHPGETVILAQPIWLEGEHAGEGASPVFACGLPLTIVERSVYDGGQLNGECFLTVTTLAGQDAPLPLVLPWQLVTHPSTWRGDEPLRELLRAVATFQLHGWYAVRIEKDWTRGIRQSLIGPGGAGIRMKSGVVDGGLSNVHHALFPAKESEA